jgi:hypothetical protein
VPCFCVQYTGVINTEELEEKTNATSGRWMGRNGGRKGWMEDGDGEEEKVADYLRVRIDASRLAGRMWLAFSVACRVSKAGKVADESLISGYELGVTAPKYINTRTMLTEDAQNKIYIINSRGDVTVC